MVACFARGDTKNSRIPAEVCKRAQISGSTGLSSEGYLQEISRELVQANVDEWQYYYHDYRDI